MRYRFKGQPLAILPSTGPCTKLHGRRFDAAYALLIQFIRRRTANKVLIALIDLG